LYVQLRQKFPMAKAIAYIPPESAWRIAAFSLTGQFDAYLGAIGRIAAGYDRLLDFSIPSPLTESRDPKATYDGSHYSRPANGRVATALLGDAGDLALDWRGREVGDTIALYRRQLAEFIAATNQASAENRSPAKPVSPQ